MTHRRPPLVLRGLPAAGGLAHGPLVLLDATTPLAALPRRDGMDDPTRLRGAIDEACRELAVLMARNADADAKALLAFQIAMLEDTVVTEPAFDAMSTGERAEHAWHRAMELQLVQYDDAEDAYFRTRGADLRDIRDRVLRALAGTHVARVPSDSIVVATDLPPSRFLEIDWGNGGLALTHGGLNSHVALLARARGVPLLVGLEFAALDGHERALIDADDGRFVASPDAAATHAFSERQTAWRSARTKADASLALPTCTADGERVFLSINVADGTELATLDPAWCDGIGLVRTELLLRTYHDLLDEPRQYEAYTRLAQWAQGRPVNIRLLDAGGDKPIPGYSAEGETNPFLGLRGVRLSLQHRDVLQVQLRAIARAGVHGPLQVLVPMVTSPIELTQIRRALRIAIESLERAGIAHTVPAVGMMVEVPAAALTCDLFDADFLSIGSNDLLQYLTACSRDSARLAPLQDPLQPAMLRLLRDVVRAAGARGLPVALCGDMAGDPRCVSALLDLGLRRLSISPALLAATKNAIARYRTTRPAQEHRS